MALNSFVVNGLVEIRNPSLPNKQASVELLPEDVSLEMAVAEFRREIAVGQNVNASYLAVKEPEEGDNGERETDIASILELYRRRLTEHAKYSLGYPINHDFDYGALAQLQHFVINNCGDPFIECNYAVHSRQFEVGVLDWFARLWALNTNDYWVYVTSGGTEGNMHGILSGREVFPNGILYASRESHYSVFKAARMYRMECVRVETLVSGQMDCADFVKRLSENRDKPAIVNVNIGSTVKGAVDDLDLIIKTLEENGFQNRFYIHCDGALFGMMMPFVKQAPKISFQKPIGSISVSGHKFVGCPVPCGVLITRSEHMVNLATDVEYISSRDATITGSRNGHAAIFLWYTLNKKGCSGFEKDVEKCLRNANYLNDRLKDAGISSMLNEFSNTVVFERPTDVEFVRRWQLACEGKLSHIVVMPSVTIDMLNSFTNELVEKRRTWYRDGGVDSFPCVAGDLGLKNCLCPAQEVSFFAAPSWVRLLLALTAYVSFVVLPSCSRIMTVKRISMFF